MEILIGSFNAHKVQEIRAMLAGIGNLQLRACNEIPGLADVPETGTTFRENALIKAKSYATSTRLPCFADDSGLEVDALDGAPGVYSARYAGPTANDRSNRAKLLAALKDVPEEERTARFTTVICYLDEHGQPHYFDGSIEGHLLSEERGTSGFGYDPLFVPGGYAQTFAEISASEKNRISHRAVAMKLFTKYLRSTYGS